MTEPTWTVPSDVAFITGMVIGAWLSAFGISLFRTICRRSIEP